MVMSNYINLLRRFLAIAIFAFVLIANLQAGIQAAEKQTHWPQWRGPLATGVAPDADPPTQWSELKNVRWKTAMPGKGHSTPVVWGSKIFLTTALPFGEPFEAKPDTAPGAHDNSPVTRRHRFEVLAVDRTSGKIVWRKTVRQARPHEGGHTSGSLASASPVTDGKHVWAFFGSHGLYCLDLDGKPIWEADLGTLQSKHAHGEGSSPVLHGNTLAVNWDHEGDSFVVAFDKRTGRERWKVKREEVTSWSSPIVVEHEGRPQLIVSGTKRVRGYDLATGKVIWQCGGLSANVVASPVAAGGMVFVASSYEKQAMLAIRLDGAKGDITGTKQVVWRRIRRTPYVPSPLLYGKSLYFLRHYQGILSRVATDTGEERHGPFRLDGIRNIYASPVGAANRVYITDRDGITLVISHNDEPKVIAMNRLNDRFSASAAIVGKEMFLRGEKYLYCLAEKR